MSEKKLGEVLRIEGVVQRVGFRRFAEQVARECRVSGYVENARDGSVRVFVQGTRAQLDAVASRLKQAASPIVIDEVKASAARVRPSLRHFQIKTGPLAEEFQEGFGAMEAEFRDYREEFRDYREEFRDFTGKTQTNFDSLSSKYGEISEKLTQILHELRTENKEAMDSLNRSVQALQRAVERLGQGTG